MWLLRLIRRPKPECDSIAALEEAQQNLKKIRARTPEVLHVKRESQEILRKNHFMEKLGEIMWRAP